MQGHVFSSGLSSTAQLNLVKLGNEIYDKDAIFLQVKVLYIKARQKGTMTKAYAQYPS